MGPGFGKGLGDLVAVSLVLMAIALPLGLWKLVEIIVWVIAKAGAP